MEIVLIRHGRPENATNKVLNAAGFANWVKNYNHSKVSAFSQPCSNSQCEYDGYFTVSSDLPRAVDSCQIFSAKRPNFCSSLYREMAIPYYKLPFKLHAWTWVYLNRFLWMCGKKGKFESYTDAKRRAYKAAKELVYLAQTHDKIIVFSHGFLILHIRKELRDFGFTTVAKSNDYWGVSALTMFGR